MYTNYMHGLFASFKYAFQGFNESAKQRNFKIHILLGIIVTILGLLLNISQTEWLALIFAVALVMAAEMFNTAIESLADIIKEQNNLRYGSTRVPRDVAAGAVLVVSVAAALVGLFIFGSPLLQTIGI